MWLQPLFLPKFIHCIHEIQRGFQRASASKYVLSNWAKYKIEIINFFFSCVQSLLSMTKGKYHLHFQSWQYSPSCRHVVPSCFSSCSALGRSARSSKTCVSLSLTSPPHPTVSGRRKVPRGFLFLPLQNKKVILAYYQPYPPVSLLPKTKARHKYFFCAGSLWLRGWTGRSPSRLPFVSFLR